jgi:hypothetical protein
MPERPALRRSSPGDFVYWLYTSHTVLEPELLANLLLVEAYDDLTVYGSGGR